MPRKTFTYEGKRYDITAKTEAELYEKIARKKLELEQGKIKESSILTKHYAKQWLEVYKEPYVVTKTYKSYVSTVNCLNSYIGSIQLKHVTATDLQKMITSEYNKGRSKSHMNKLMLTIKQIFKQAKIDRKIIEDPAEYIKEPKVEEKPGRAVTNEERKVILKVAESHRYGRWVRGMMYLGFRPSETALIQGKDIDIENLTLHIRGTKSRKADRYVPIPEFLIDDFSGFYGEEYIYTTLAGNPPDEQRRTAWWHAFKRDLDIEMGARLYRNQIIESVVADDLTAYCLRHTYGTDGQAAGIPIDVLADLMGHESVSTTRRYYIHDNQESRDKAREAMELFHKEKTPMWE